VVSNKKSIKRGKLNQIIKPKKLKPVIDEN
jgi:hypothetical protein